MASYAGIGSRDITDREAERAYKVAKLLFKNGFTLYSGNAGGADISFQHGARPKDIAMLPWKRFNYNDNVPTTGINCGDSEAGAISVKKYHPAPDNLSQAAEKMMARNYHQIVGYEDLEQVSFVVCIAEKTSSGVKGGTGQAVRIAEDLGIPVFNIRYEDEFENLKALIKKQSIT